MSSNVQVRIEGLDKLIKKANRNALMAEPLRNFFKRSVVIVQRNVKKRTPVDVGNLRNNINTEVDPSPVPLWGRIGTAEQYAKPVEFGTGLKSDAPDSKRSRYFPPPSALEPWAQRHGFESGFVVALAIYRAGGTPPKRMFREGMKDSLSDISREITKCGDAMAKKWGK